MCQCIIQGAKTLGSDMRWRIDGYYHVYLPTRKVSAAGGCIQYGIRELYELPGMIFCL